jgi:outer membrane protein TolC
MNRSSGTPLEDMTSNELRAEVLRLVVEVARLRAALERAEAAMDEVAKALAILAGATTSSDAAMISRETTP